jgi:hypothetical protein
MNRYGLIAQRHWARWLPRQYAAINDLGSFLPRSERKSPGRSTT